MGKAKESKAETRGSTLNIHGVLFGLLSHTVPLPTEKVTKTIKMHGKKCNLVTK